MSKHIPVEQRIAADIERGDLRLARDRLASHTQTVGYSPAAMDRIARICLDMRDPYEAGAFSQIAQFARLAELNDYPSHVQVRLLALAITPEIVKSGGRIGPLPSPTPWQDVAMAWLVGVSMLACVAWALFSLGRYIFWK